MIDPDTLILTLHNNGTPVLTIAALCYRRYIPLFPIQKTLADYENKVKEILDEHSEQADKGANDTPVTQG